MRSLKHRIHALEAASPASEWRPVLELLSNTELDQLEAIVARLAAGSQSSRLVESDRMLIAKVQGLKADEGAPRPCA